MIKLMLGLVFSSLLRGEEKPLDPDIAKWGLPAKLPAAYSEEEKCEAVAAFIRATAESGKVSHRIVNRICGYYNVSLKGKGVFKQDPHNSEMLIFIEK